MLFLHGGGESGEPREGQGEWPPKLIAGNERAFPCIVVSPQSPGRGWNPDYLAALLDDICATYRGRSRADLPHGAEHGGLWLLDAGGRAAQPLRGDRADLWRRKSCRCRHAEGHSIWVFHGAEDKTVNWKISTRW